MTHAHVLRRLSAYLEADLGPEEERFLEAHLAECAECAAELRALRRAIELLHALPAPESPSGLGDAVIERLRAGEARPAWSWPFFQLFAGESWLGGFAPVAAALGVGAVAWLLTPDLLPLREPESAPAGQYAATAAAPPRSPGSAGPLTIAAGEKAAAALPVRGAASLPRLQVCLEQARIGVAGKDECAGWYAWWVAKALEDAGGFADEVDRLPAQARGPWLGRISEFAQRSGSTHRVWEQLRNSRDPGAVRIAKRFERSGGPIRQAAWQGH
jgi:hypothetical protein